MQVTQLELFRCEYVLYLSLLSVWRVALALLQVDHVSCRAFYGLQHSLVSFLLQVCIATLEKLQKNNFSDVKPPFEYSARHGESFLDVISFSEELVFP